MTSEKLDSRLLTIEIRSVALFEDLHVRRVRTVIDRMYYRKPKSKESDLAIGTAISVTKDPRGSLKEIERIGTERRTGALIGVARSILQEE